MAKRSGKQIEDRTHNIIINQIAVWCSQLNIAAEVSKGSERGSDVKIQHDKKKILIEVESYHVPAKLKVWANRHRAENALATIIISGLAATYRKNIAEGDWPDDLPVFCIDTNDWKTLIPSLLTKLLRLNGP
jgi:hypothetical protein